MSFFLTAKVAFRGSDQTGTSISKTLIFVDVALEATELIYDPVTTRYSLLKTVKSFFGNLNK